MKEIILPLCFLSSFMLAIGILYILLLQNKREQERLHYYLEINEKYKKEKKKKSKEKVKLPDLNGVNELISGSLNESHSEKLLQDLRSAGVQMDPGEYITFAIIVAVISGLLLGLVTGQGLLIIPGTVLGFFIPKLWLGGKRKSRIKLFNDALPDMITTIIGSLKAGFSFTQAMKTVSEESEAPVKDEVLVFLKEMNYGATMEEALNNLRARMPSNDLDLMIQAILIQRQVGGNLSLILEVIVKTIRERNEIDRHVRSLTAQGKLSGKVVGLLPFFIFIILYLINPEYMSPFFTNILGQILLGVGVVMEIIGFIIMNKLAKIEV